MIIILCQDVYLYSCYDAFIFPISITRMQNGSENQTIMPLLNEAPGDGIQEYQWPMMEEWIAEKMSHHEKAKSFLLLKRIRKSYMPRGRDHVHCTTAIR